jgi:hypothetical protein
MAKVNWSGKLEPEMKEEIQIFVKENPEITNENIILKGYEFYSKKEIQTGINISDPALRERVEELTGEDGFFHFDELIKEGITALESEVVEEENTFSVDEREFKLLQQIKEKKLTSKVETMIIDIDADKEKKELKKFFTKSNFTLDCFEKMPFDLTDPTDRMKLSSLTYWEPYQTVMVSSKGTLYYVADVDYKFDRVAFGIVGEKVGETFPMKTIFRNLTKVKLYTLKPKTQREEVLKKHIAKTQKGKKGSESGGE